MSDERVQQLTEGQRACLRMVLHHMSSKDIARALGISPHTVDQRLKQAMKTLGAASRVEAARTLLAHEGEPAHQKLVHQALVHQSPDVDAAASRPPVSSHTRGDEHHDGLRRTAWIVAIIAGVAVIFAALFAGLNALSEFTR